MHCSTIVLLIEGRYLVQRSKRLYWLWERGYGASRASGSCSRLVVISTSMGRSEQLLRAHALLEAGAQNVLVAMWNPPQMVRRRYLTSVYDSLNRDRTPGRALAEARESLVADASRSADQTDPSYWGAYLLVGEP